jgi:hypothetical protein
MSKNANSTPAAQAARNASNATKVNAKPPVQRMPVPNQGPSSIKLPPVQKGTKPTIGPGLPSRISQPLGGTVITYPPGCCPTTGPGSVGPGFRGK